VAAREALLGAAALFRERGDTRGLARALNRLGPVLHHAGSDELALEHLEECLALFRSLGDRAGEARALGGLGYVAGEQRRLDVACRLMEASLAIEREIGDRQSLSMALNDLGYVVYLLGDTARARALLDESLAIRRAVDYRKGIAVTLDNLGYVGIAEGRLDEARERFAEALAIGLEIQATPVVLDVVIGLAVLRARAGAAATAVELLAFVAAHPASWTESSEDVARLMGEIAPDLAPDEVERATARGAALDLDTATARALRRHRTASGSDRLDGER
jgi:non-specific serine/threonine protein kinase